ncbi:GDSL esterase/lipase [Rhynchospora pubera]|uniref:GDSL esterase/lipase n=1 Tax=Rhynchospora pubera TaxID=906938 RepID=A0AAV8E771_9POAL|nr:GDSL esterase/lipase [Rhynchospora pubera]
MHLHGFIKSELLGDRSITFNPKMRSSNLILFTFLGLVILSTLLPPLDARAFFVFGDSLVDSGNNNYLMTEARADTFPYGIDYPTHRATGRFSNGFNIPDLISQYIGSEPPLPCLSPELHGEKLLVGANFASAGVGILNDTGFQFANIMRIDEQLQKFTEYQRTLRSYIGAEKAKELVNKALVLITVGGNDFVNNYYLLPYSARSREFSLPDYVNYLTFEYKKILLRLYDYGARRVLVTGTGPLGCAPAEIALRSTDGNCAEELMRATDLFNPKIVQLLKELNSQYGSDVFTAANSNRMHFDFVMNPKAYGFKTAKIACCGEGRYNGIGICSRLSNLCKNRDEHVFWDAYHPTERANRLIVNRMMTGSTDYMSPMNLSTILALDEIH